MAQISRWLSEGEALDGYAIDRRRREINTEPLKKAVENYKPAWLRNRPAPAPTEPAHPLPQAGPAVQEVNPEDFEPDFEPAYQSPFAVPPVVGSGLANIFALFQEIEERNNTN